MSSVESPNAARDFGEPFNATDADIILRSVENVDFRAHRLVLRLASPVFADMITLAAPSTTDDELKDGLPVVQMIETERALHLLLCFCYPNTIPPVHVLDDFSLAVHVISKFELGHAKHLVTSLLRAHVQEAPERVYALAWLLQSRELVLLSAKASLAMPVLRDRTPPREFEHITAYALQELLSFHFRCMQQVASLREGWKWVTPGSVPAQCHKSTGSHDRSCRCDYRTVSLSNGSQVAIRSWCQAYVDAACIAYQNEGALTAITRLTTCSAALLSAHECSNCKTEASVALDKFSLVLKTRVEDIVAEAATKLQTPFQTT
ncbi:hypothetical protein PENSPDRAFT_754442 [Peniophora sp. CONT]|nr:hypothetical protein PENSPDRAFT_754442 [Peniophora sp. CONT]